MPQAQSRRLVRALQLLHPELDDPLAVIAAGHVTVDGFVVTNPESRVRPGSAVRVTVPVPLRGEAKLGAAMAAFGVSATGRAALDVGAAAGGFTKVLLQHGARRVYACDAGHGQLLGSLRQDPRVVNLEATNVAALTTALVPEAIGVVSIDVSYLALGDAVAQLGGVTFDPGADLMGLVKPMFELKRPTAPVDDESVLAARDLAAGSIQAAGWEVMDSIPSPVTGARGAREMLIHARRRG